jgi:hypothetical protein
LHFNDAIYATSFDENKQQWQQQKHKSDEGKIEEKVVKEKNCY